MIFILPLILLRILIIQPPPKEILQQRREATTKLGQLNVGSANNLQRVSDHNIFKENAGRTQSAKSKIQSEIDA